MLRTTYLALLLLYFSGLVVSQKKGGGSNSDDDFDAGDIDWNDDHGGSGSGGTTTSSGTSRPCGWGVCGCRMMYERQRLFSLPGLYYNGSITIRHHIKNNTAWNDEDLTNGCENDDGSPKTYTYPGLLLIAPTGNASDTNPIHWALRGFQPADQLTGTGGPYIDLRQRWVHIRSSDFVMTGNESQSPWHIWPNYLSSDATDTHQGTRVYWHTNVTSTGNNTFSARAQYAESPPTTRQSKGFEGDWGRYSSQYVTLSDVCVWNQRFADSFSTQGLPRSQIPNDKVNYATSIPTLWLTEGVTAEMRDIGADIMTFTLNNSFTAAVPLIGERKAQCDSDASTQLFEFEDFDAVHSSNDRGSVKPWNLTLDVSITFRGSLVAENSTRITGFDGGVPVFEASYEPPADPRAKNDEENAGWLMRAGSGVYNPLVALVVLGILL